MSLVFAIVFASVVERFIVLIILYIPPLVNFDRIQVQGPLSLDPGLCRVPDAIPKKGLPVFPEGLRMLRKKREEMYSAQGGRQECRG